MGKLEKDPVIHHFSHPHPLELTNHKQQTHDTPTCAACNTSLSGWTYRCKSCRYHLDLDCAELPRKILHPCDPKPKHAFTLFASPVYSVGCFECNACGEMGKGFCYHCKECKIDLHVACSKKPLSINYMSHGHPLNLTFSSPYGEKGYLCNVCGRLGSNQWLYRCSTCGFDAHLDCVGDNQVLNHLHHHLQQQQQHLVQLQVQQPQFPLQTSSTNIRGTYRPPQHGLYVNPQQTQQPLIGLISGTRTMDGMNHPPMYPQHVMRPQYAPAGGRSEFVDGLGGSLLKAALEGGIQGFFQNSFGGGTSTPGIDVSTALDPGLGLDTLSGLPGIDFSC
ncbi:hypothetical protein QJS04_geneDACA018933 [Acorus gramineus]|uniref:DC1 domain-containing protein n=1 Tax=Acorus gramineus TaxID=55184 RepID=A0AAV9AAF6_ACOGR|nr:hypothetical protein QJS04_geneDACA018933 [Acorus gramineus]